MMGGFGRTLTVALAVLAASPAPAQDFEAFSRAYAAAPAERREALADAFLAGVRSPLIAPDGTVTFLFRADRPGRRVAVRSDFTPRNVNDHNWLEAGEAMPPLAAEGTLHVLRRRLEPDARIDYQLVVDGEVRIDPLNPRHRDGAIRGEVSELVMPAYREPALLPSLAAPPAGRMVAVEEPWARPRVRVYLPAGYDPARRYPVLYVPDGAAWSDHFRLPQMLDAMIAGRRIRPVIAVLMDAPEDRARFYYFAPDYLDYVERVVAYVDGRYPTFAEPRHRAHFGTSAGARAALFTTLERPALFGNIAMLSPSISGPPHFYAALLSGGRRLPRLRRVWISAGRYEPALQADARLMERLFRRDGSPVLARYTNEGHSMATWRNMLPQVLEYVFSPAPD
jgi:enterochelin esterase-like enzyme